MFRILTLLIFSLSVCTLIAQPTHDWYAADPTRPFAKLLVAHDGVYRVEVNDLLASGYDLRGVSPSSIQLFYRGREIPLKIATNAQQGFASLTFVGHRNDGRVESSLYMDPFAGLPDESGQPNPHFSLYSDTSAYFLTWGHAPGQRYQVAADTHFQRYTPEAAYPFETIWEPHPDSTSASRQKAIAVTHGGGPYDSYYALNSDFITGEGYISEQDFRVSAPFTTSFLNTPQAISGPQDVRFRLRIFHRSNTEHHIQVHLAGLPIQRILDTLMSFNTIAVGNYEGNIQTSLGDQTELTFKALRQPTDNNHLTSIRIRYLRQPDLAGQASTWISEWNRPAGSPAYFRFANAAGQQKAWVFDEKWGICYEGRVSGGSAHVVLNGPMYGERIALVTDQGLQKPLIAPQTHLRNLCAPDSGAAFVIIAPRSLATSARAYAQYRDTNRFNPLSSRVIFTDEIYDEFGYGSPTPQAIQAFVDCALQNWSTPPRFLLLWGKGKVWVRRESIPIVPSYGYPANDIAYTFDPDAQPNTYLGRVAVGRVNVRNDNEGLDYLDKVRDFEGLPPTAPWRKKGIFLGGGATIGEQDAIRDAMLRFMESYQDTAHWSGDTLSFQKGWSAPADSVLYHQAIDSGVGLIAFFGHASINLYDVYIKEAFEYQSFGHYPMMLAMGCYGGDFTGGSSFGERWLVEPGRGAIAYLANSTAGYLNPLRDFGRVWFPQTFQKMLGQPIGEALLTTYNRYVDSLPGLQYRNHARQMNLQGDPSLVIFPSSRPITSLQEEPWADGLAVYPNPAREVVVVESRGAALETVSLWSLSGQVLREVSNPHPVNRLQLDLSGLSPGVYVLQVKGQEKWFWKRVVITR
jgi:hypothetical protein